MTRVIVVMVVAVIEIVVVVVLYCGSDEGVTRRTNDDGAARSNRSCDEPRRAVGTPRPPSFATREREREWPPAALPRVCNVMYCHRI